METKPNCPECSELMVRRNGKYGKFWGCPNFPRCRGTRSMNNPKPEFKKKQEKEFFKPSPYQEAIFECVKNGGGNALVEAVAGSGKTTTIVKALQFTPKDAKVAFVAFNVAIARELKDRAPDHVQVSTLHSLGLKNISTWLGTKPKVDDKKVFNILESILDLYDRESPDWDLVSPLKKMVSLAKATLVDPGDPVALDEMCDRYGIELNGYGPKLFSLLPIVLEKCKRLTGLVDFDDMIWLPVALNIGCEQFDVLMVDEAQDLNATQIQLVLKSIKPNGRVICVGDRNQSIYGFRGADTQAIPNLIEALGAKTLPLSITYRCPKSHVELAQTIVPEIEAAEWAKEGSIDYLPMTRIMGIVQSGDLILCRTNSPLVPVCFSLIRNGIKATIRGRDIGQGLINLVQKMKTTSIISFWTKLRSYEARECAKLLQLEKTSQLAALQDRIDTIVAIGENVSTIEELVAKIDSIFDDNVEGVVCSSIHRAKGLEAGRIIIVRPDLLPHPLAQRPWEMQQEQNLAYVAYTRSKSELIFVQD